MIKFIILDNLFKIFTLINENIIPAINVVIEIIKNMYATIAFQAGLYPFAEIAFIPIGPLLYISDPRYSPKPNTVNIKAINNP